MKNKFQISIASCVALISAFLTVVSMMEYAVFQFHYHPGYTVKDLFIEHGWHVVVFGFIIYLLSYLFFYYQIKKPVSSLWLKCYVITKGYRDDVNINSNIKEIQEIADAINMLEAQMVKNKELRDNQKSMED